MFDTAEEGRDETFEASNYNGKNRKVCAFIVFD